MVRGRTVGWLVLCATAIVVAACSGPVAESLLGDNREPTPTATPANGMHHPAGWAAATDHGHAAKFVAEDCRSCHGATLEGGVAVGCDGCHTAGWRQSCTFCHGGADNATGAPPRDITGAVAQDDLIFKSHTKHVDTTAVAVPFTCVQCHGSIPVDALDAGHWFDDTHGRAEVNFANGLSSAGIYDPDNGRCSQNYCHSNGRGDTGVASYDDGPQACNGCHSFIGSGTTGMSGEHARHLGGGVGATCVDCHAATLNAQNAIANPSKHVNKIREVMFSGDAAAVTWTAGNQRCTGLCHGFNHNDSW